MYAQKVYRGFESLSLRHLISDTGLRSRFDHDADLSQGGRLGAYPPLVDGSEVPPTLPSDGANLNRSELECSLDEVFCQARDSLFSATMQTGQNEKSAREKCVI